MSIETEFSERGTVVENLTNLTCAKPSQRTQVPARRWKKESHEGDSLVRDSEVDGLLCNAPPEAERIGPEHQSEIPLVSFFLKTAPADISAVREKRPMP